MIVANTVAKIVASCKNLISVITFFLGICGLISKLYRE